MLIQPVGSLHVAGISALLLGICFLFCGDDAATKYEAKAKPHLLLSLSLSLSLSL